VRKGCALGELVAHRGQKEKSMTKSVTPSAAGGVSGRLTRRGVLGVGAAGLAAACATDGTASYSGKAAFRHGVASGDPRQDRVIIWTRVTPEAPGVVPVRWSVARDAAFKDVVRKGVFVTGPDRDYTVKVDVDGLQPGENYYYWFSAGAALSPGGVTRTLPATGVGDFRMAVVSCSNFPFGYFNAYREIATRNDVHAVMHVGDYIYEYGVDGYGGTTGKQLGRNHEPSTECLKIEDYRTRYAQYRSDPDLQAAHAVAPWFCTWDDHETANNSHLTGAENHQPETEGDWGQRKAAAIQAYMEWMPIRDPEAGRPREAIYRKFDIGDLATVFLLETRLIARGDDLTVGEVGLAAPADKPRVIKELMAKVNDPARTLMGPEQEAWLGEEMKASVAAGKKWQVLGNQVTMARVKAPDLKSNLSADQYAQISEGAKRFYETGKQGIPWNLDSWNGYPAARERLYALVKAANAHIVTLTGDTHCGWANELFDRNGHRLGVEFACTSVTSPGAGVGVPFEELNWLMAEANDEVVYYNAFDKGYTVLTLGESQVEADFVKVSTILSRDYFAVSDAKFLARHAEVGMGGLQRPMAKGKVTSG
jgi:alkaline phosphatase D